jgi:hypothetical protein
VLGNSGGPILDVDGNGNFEAIGVHCNGDFSGELWNSGTPFGHNANDVGKFCEAMNIARNINAVANNPKASIDARQKSVVPGMLKVAITY